MKQRTLAISPSAPSGCRVVSRDIKEISTVANVCIYLEQVIKNLKDYQILKSEMQYFFNWDSPHARLNSHYEAWSYKKKSTKKITEPLRS